MMARRTAAAFFIALTAAMPAGAQDSGDALRDAEALDRLLGPTAALPKPDPAPAATVPWLPAPAPPWLAAQPYRQQPLFATVPGNAVLGGRIRIRSSGP